MIPKIKKISELPLDSSVAYLLEDPEKLKAYSFSPTEFEHIKRELSDDKNFAFVNSYFKWSFVFQPTKESKNRKENLRKMGFELREQLKRQKIQEIVLVDVLGSKDDFSAFIEGLLLSSYAFDKYKTLDQDKEKGKLLKQVEVFSDSLEKEDLDKLLHVIEGVYFARDLVNEPLSYLTAEQLAKEIEKKSREAGYSVDVFSKKKLESLKFNGLLAVNKGSIDPPTFSVLEWKPDNAINKKPYIVIGKGVVYDTGGLSLKPTSYMDTMKSDMSGAASVAGLMHAVAKNNLPLHIIGFIPATDNRPDGNAYVPGDVIEMQNGVTVEVMNTDAEGRMLLADALVFAKKYEPELVFDLATLTGSASAAVGIHGTVVMGTAEDRQFEKLEQAGEDSYERIVRFPFWDEYKDMLKSTIADIKNVGGREAGAITAGKFLEYFVDYPWIHLDIAGTAFLDKADNYRGTGGTGVGVRLLYTFFEEISRNQK